jgi:hypothetical protein
MTTEFPIDWVGFTPSQKRQLQSRCGRFSGKVHKGDPGEPGGIWIYANDIRTFKEHWAVEMDFPSLDELARLATEVVTSAAQQWKEMTAPTIAG